MSEALPAAGALLGPVELSFVGLTACTQALIIGGGAELGNAIDATAGL